MTKSDKEFEWRVAGVSGELDETGQPKAQFSAAGKGLDNLAAVVVRLGAQVGSGSLMITHPRAGDWGCIATTRGQFLDYAYPPFRDRFVRYLRKAQEEWLASPSSEE